MIFSSVSSSSESVEDSWNTKTPMSQARFGHGVVAVEGKIYAIGGRLSYTGLVGTNECYDPKTDTWVTLEPMPTARSGFAIAVCEGKIYCVGGTIGIKYPDFSVNPYEPVAEIYAGVNECYDPSTNSWSTKASMPTNGEGFSAYVVDGQIFFLNANDGYLFKYDPVSDVWTKRASIDVIKYGPDTNSFLSFSTLLDNQILFYREYSTNSQIYNNQFMLYNPKTDKWNKTNISSFITKGNKSSAFFKP